MYFDMVDGVQIPWIPSILLEYCLGWFGWVSISRIAQFIISTSRKMNKVPKIPKNSCLFKLIRAPLIIYD